MREGFNENLSQYTDAIKKSLLDTSRDGRVKADGVREQLVTETAKESSTTIEAESEIYKIQKSKLEKLSKFKRFLQKTRDGVGGFIHPETKRDLSVLSVDTEGNFSVQISDGKKKPITIGEIMTDYEWGIEYTFDPSVNIHDIREYYLGKLKHELREKLDQQIIASEVAFTEGDTFKQQAYEKISSRNEATLEQQGVIAEKMVKNFLKKLAIDTNADFEIIDADVYQDVEQKVDFIIHRKSHSRTRGANIVESETDDHITFEDIGIQFTTAAGKTDHKEHQIAQSKRRLKHLNDLVLVTLPAHDASHLYKRWKEYKTSGGPEKLWSPSVQETIFRGVMTKVLTGEEIEAFCTQHFQHNQ